jgi:hypothetical protein
MLLKNADIEQILIDDLETYKKQHSKYFNDVRDRNYRAYSAPHNGADFFKNL